MGEPWLLTESMSIYAKVVAVNEIGDSELSARGNGAQLVISTVPDAPTLRGWVCRQHPSSSLFQ